MKIALAFDVYGTLVDTSSVALILQDSVGDKAGEFARVWREKQLEYTFRRGLMERYESFPVCVRDSLDYTAEYLGTPLSTVEKETLLDAYRLLPVFDDVTMSLDDLQKAGFDLYAFSNGTRQGIAAMLEFADIGDCFIDIVSVEEVGTFKPSPRVYRHFLERADVEGDSAWLISGNPFDVMGAISAGMHGAWVRRSGDQVFDPWGIEPTVTVSSLDQLGAAIGDFHSAG